MTKFLILHGTDASPQSNWFMWLKGVLIGKGHQVWLPELPDSDIPSTKRYNEFLLANEGFTFDQDTVIIGHSSGSVAALNLLQHLPEGSVVGAAILVSAFENDLGWDVLKGLFEEPLDCDAINDHCSYIRFIHSDNDPHVELSQAEHLTEELDGELTIIEGQGHFNTDQDPSYKQFPALLDIILGLL